MLLITQLSEANNFLFVYPCGSLSLVFIPSWNAGVCCQPGIVPPRDDIEFARQMILVLACRCRNGVLTAMWCQLCSKSSRTSRTSTPVVSTHRVRCTMPALCNLQFATFGQDSPMEPCFPRSSLAKSPCCVDFSPLSCVLSSAGTESVRCLRVRRWSRRNRTGWVACVPRVTSC